jgi:F-type H+-transporting ATPase subunit gamma
LPNLQKLHHRIESADDLLSVVKTMKSMAAVNIHQYEQAVKALAEYDRTVQMGFRVLLSQRPDMVGGARRARVVRIGVVVFGSDQGMCGAFNERVASFARQTIDAEQLRHKNAAGEPVQVLSVGHRVRVRLEDVGLAPQCHFDVPGSVAAVTILVHDLLVELSRWRSDEAVDQVLVCYNDPAAGSAFEPTVRHLLPLDQGWLERLDAAEGEWPTNQLPTFSMDADMLFSALVQEYLFGALYRACADSLAAENASRLASMHAAQRNIEDLLDELRSEYRRTRQSAITEELLDIMGGYEALLSQDPRPREDND